MLQILLVSTSTAEILAKEFVEQMQNVQLQIIFQFVVVLEVLLEMLLADVEKKLKMIVSFFSIHLYLNSSSHKFLV